MTDYDPFARGPHPVGVRTVEVYVADRDATVPVEVWYPATEAVAGRDVDPATKDHYELMPGMAAPQDAVRDAEALPGPHTGIVFSHGFGGHRRQSTFYCTHLASHGYVVASPDHVGNTTMDLFGLFAGGADEAAFEANVTESIRRRPHDARAALDALVSAAAGVAAAPARVGITGHSFGGWTTLQTTGGEPRVAAAVPLAPAGGLSGFSANDDPTQDIRHKHFAGSLELDWGREVPTLLLAAEEDSLLPLAGMHDLLERGPSIDKMVVLANADHYHFCDNVEMIHDLMAPMMGGQTKTSADFVPGAVSQAFTNGLGLAHFDAHLRGHDAAAALVAGDLAELLAERGITATVVTA